MDKKHNRITCRWSAQGSVRHRPADLNDDRLCPECRLLCSMSGEAKGEGRPAFQYFASAAFTNSFV